MIRNKDKVLRKDGSLMITKANKKDVKAISELASQLYETPASQLVAEFNELLEDKKALVLVLKIDNEVKGFCHVQLRYEYVEGCETSPVGYLEGIYINEADRKKGYGTQMLEEGKTWAKEKGCREFASDTELDNKVGYLFHKDSGFIETNRLITFKQDL